MNEKDTLHEALTRVSQTVLISVALLQGIVIYVLSMYAVEAIPSFEFRMALIIFVVSVPTIFLLSAQNLRDRLLWQNLALAAAIIVPIAGFFSWVMGPGLGFARSTSIALFSWHIFLVGFIATAFFQSRLVRRSFRWHYPTLFHFAWKNALVLWTAVFFTLLSWLVLVLWAALFELIQIDFFGRLFGHDFFIAAMTGLLFGLGVVIGRSQPRAIDASRRLVFMVATWLLPVLAGILIVFTLALPFTGVTLIWERQHPVDWEVTNVLLMMIVLLVVFLNAVLQTGEQPLPYPKWLQLIVRFGLTVAPLLASLVLISVVVRISDQGITPSVYWLGVFGLLFLLHTLGYAVLTWWRGRSPEWLLSRVNISVALVAMPLILLSYTPVLDVYRMSAASQAERIDWSVPNQLEFEHQVSWLRFNTGRYGPEYHRKWLGDPDYAEFAPTLQHALDADNPYWMHRLDRTVDSDRSGDWVSRITGAAPSEELAQVMKQRLPNARCEEQPCFALYFALFMDAEGRGQEDTGYLVCEVNNQSRGFASCTVFGEREQGVGWKYIGYVLTHQEAELTALQSGDIQLELPCTHVLIVGEQRHAFNDAACQP